MSAARHTTPGPHAPHPRTTTVRYSGLNNARLKRAEQSWREQVDAWKAELERLARSFAAGEALVDPKPGACDYCDQKPFCRIHEREAGPGEAEDEA